MGCSRTPVASASIADNAFFNDTDGQRQQVTTFVDETVWGKSGEDFAALAKKGQEIIVEARAPAQATRESEDGQKHFKHYLKAESWQFTSKGKQGIAASGRSTEGQEITLLPRASGGQGSMSPPVPTSMAPTSIRN